MSVACDCDFGDSKRSWHFQARSSITPPAVARAFQVRAPYVPDWALAVILAIFEKKQAKELHQHSNLGDHVTARNHENVRCACLEPPRDLSDSSGTS